eukprot:6194759-Pleurochrysis_carterae.AAC.1
MPKSYVPQSCQSSEAIEAGLIWRPLRLPSAPRAILPQRARITVFGIVSIGAITPRLIMKKYRASYSPSTQPHREDRGKETSGSRYRHALGSQLNRITKELRNGA